MAHFKVVGDFRKSSRAGVRLLVNFCLPPDPGHAGPKTGGNHINTQILARAHAPTHALVWIAAVAIPLMLLAPALWNGYPLLQWDTGGYLARWYEGYLVPSRSTVFGLYLHFGEDSAFWINLGIQALATLWILQLTLRVFGMAQPLRLLAIGLALVLTTGAAMACQHAPDRHLCRPVGAVAVHPGRCMASRPRQSKNASLFAFTAFAAATHSATLAVLLGLVLPRTGSCARCCADGIADCRTCSGQPDHRRRCCDAVGGEFRAVGTIGLDARRLRRRLRADAAGWHRRALSAGSLPAAKAEALPLSQSNCRPPPTSFCGATACSTRSAASRA